MGDSTPHCGTLSSPPNDKRLTVTENLPGVTLVLEYGREEGRRQPGREAGGTAIPALFVIHGHPVHAWHCPQAFSDIIPLNLTVFRAELKALWVKGAAGRPSC